MAIENLQVPDIIEVMEDFIQRKRPPEHIRPKLNIGYKIDDQSITTHEIRPFGDEPEDHNRKDRNFNRAIV